MNIAQEQSERVFREAREYSEKYGYYPSYDCGTKALAIAANISYWNAINLLKGSRTIGHKITKNSPINGFWFKGFKPKKARTTRDFAKMYPSGRFIVYCYHRPGHKSKYSMAHHYVAVIDGQRSDDSNLYVKYAFSC